MNRNDWFRVSKLSESVILVKEPLSILFPDFMTNWVNLFIISDHDESLLIDTGTGLFSYKSFTRQVLRSKLIEVTTFTTHSHFDHVGSLHEFNNTLIHKNEMKPLLEDENLNYIRNYLIEKNDPIASIIPDNFIRKKVNPANFTTVEDGEWIRVGKKEVQSISLPGHSSGSLGLYHPDEKLFFVGDTIQNGYVYADNNLDNFKRSLDKILSIIDSDMTQIMPSHEDIWLTKDSVTELITLIEKYQSNDLAGMKVNSISNNYLDNPLLISGKFNIILPKTEKIKNNNL